MSRPVSLLRVDRAVVTLSPASERALGVYANEQPSSSLRFATAEKVTTRYAVVKVAS